MNAIIVAKTGMGEESMTESVAGLAVSQWVKGKISLIDGTMMVAALSSAAAGFLWVGMNFLG